METKKHFSWQVAITAVAVCITVVSVLWSAASDRQGIKDEQAALRAKVEGQGAAIEQLQKEMNTLPVLSQGFTDIKDQLVLMNNALTKNQDNILDLLKRHK